MMKLPCSVSTQRSMKKNLAVPFGYSKTIYFQMKVVDFFLFSNIFIALGASAQTLLTYQLLQKKCSISVIIFVFLSTLITYNFYYLNHRPVKLPHSNKLTWLTNNYALFCAISLLALVSLPCLFFLLSTSQKTIISILGLLVWFYYHPFPYCKYSLRTLIGFKIGVIAFVWTSVITLLPAMEVVVDRITLKKLSIHYAQQYLFIVAITIPFDYRDVVYDIKEGIKTFPVIFGKQVAKVLALCLCSVSVGLYLWKHHHLITILTAVVLWIITLGVLWNNSMNIIIFSDNVYISINFSL